MKVNHKYKSKFIPGEKYSLVIYCQYCGHVAWYTNETNQNIERQKIAREACLLNPKEYKKTKV